MKIHQFPDPLLREKSLFIKEMDDKTAGFMERLKDRMYISKGCVGVATPQVGELKRIVVVDATGHKKVPVSHGLLLMANPQILAVSGSTINREGCLSVPDYTGNVERGDYVKVKYMDNNGEEKIIEAHGFEAVILQHEIDHLDGILFIDRVQNTKRDLFPRKSY